LGRPRSNRRSSIIRDGVSVTNTMSGKETAIEYLAEILKAPDDKEHVVFFATRAIQALVVSNKKTPCQ
jgi:hypothetical protein